MQFLSALLVACNVASVAYAAAVPEAAVEMPAEAAALMKREDLVLALYENINFGGRLLVINPGEGCANVPANFNDITSSVIVGDNTGCFLYSDSNCKGKILTIGGNNPSLYRNLNEQNFNDVLSSYLCVRLK